MTNELEGSRGKVDVLLTLLQSMPTEADCDRCLAEMTAYVTVQLEGGDYQVEFPFVAQHLDGCVACAEAYARVYEVELAERNGYFDLDQYRRLPQSAHIPQPDLSFLAPAADLWGALQSALHITQTRITLQLDAILTALLAPQPSLALTRAAESGRFGQQLLALTPDQTPETALPFSLAVYADKENPEMCLVEITVETPGLSWPDLGGNQVNTNYAKTVLQEVTDDWGTAVFPDIPRTELENLRFEIILQELN